MAGSLTLEEARRIIDRGIEKARELGRREALVVVDEGGNVISVSRMDGAPPASVRISRAKAYLAAVIKGPTKPFADRMHAHPERWDAWKSVMPEHMLPGPGGMPIVKDGNVIGGVAASISVQLSGVDPNKFVLNGERVNAEDYIIASALEIPYKSQHGPSTYQLVPFQEG